MTKNQKTEPMEVDQHITAHSRYYAGKAGSFFYRTLRDDQKILASQCEKCGMVFWPPRSICGHCFSSLPTENMLAVGPEGTLESFTCLTYQSPAHPTEKPPIYGIIKLDGADTGMAHLLGEVDAENLKIGMRMTPVFVDKRNGNILDIQYFKPV